MRELGKTQFIPLFMLKKIIFAPCNQTKIFKVRQLEN